MTKQELAEIIKKHLDNMIDNQKVGYLQINIGGNGNIVIHTHLTHPPVKIDTSNKKNLENKNNT